MMQIADEVSRASKILIFKEPFYGLYLIGLNKIYSEEIPTAGVSKHNIGVQLIINPKFFTNLSENHRIGLIKHELLHISFGHLLIRSMYPDKKLFNIAADLEINQYIDSDYLPDGGLTLNSFPELNLPVRAGTKVYYDILLQNANNGVCPNLDNLLSKIENGDGIQHDWEDFDNLPDAEKKLIEKQIEHQLKEIAEQTEKRRGNIPGELAEKIKKLRTVEPPKFDWKGYLRRFVGNSSISYTKKLRRKYNKRYSGNPGLKIKFKNHILVGVDTSGSVSSKELVEFMNELNHMYKTGHKITVAQCDTRINSIEEFNPKKDWDIKGRGGTAFQPVIDHFNEFRSYTALIYLTDGECSSPINCPKNTLWVLSSISNVNNNLPGKVIKLN
jgi:predicted metal-dependent peptidase